MNRYVASYAVKIGFSVLHGIVCCDATDPQQAFTRMKENLLKEKPLGRIHIANILSVADILDNEARLIPEEYE